jgi:hypothetical protein
MGLPYIRFLFERQVDGEPKEAPVIEVAPVVVS